MENAVQVWSDGPIVYCASPSGTRWPHANMHTAERARKEVKRMVDGLCSSYDIEGRRPVFTRRKVK